MNSREWADYVRLKRKEKQFTRRYVAEVAGIDPGYVTLIERDGLIPSRAVAAKIGKALGNEHETLIVAGFVPAEASKPKLLMHVTDGYVDTHLSSNARQLILRLKDMDKRDQEKASLLLLNILDSYQRSNPAKKKTLKAVSA